MVGEVAKAIVDHRPSTIIVLCTKYLFLRMQGKWEFWDLDEIERASTTYLDSC